LLVCLFVYENGNKVQEQMYQSLKPHCPSKHVFIE